MCKNEGMTQMQVQTVEIQTLVGFRCMYFIIQAGYHDMIFKIWWLCQDFRLHFTWHFFCQIYLWFFWLFQVGQQLEHLAANINTQLGGTRNVCSLNLWLPHRFLSEYGLNLSFSISVAISLTLVLIFWYVLVHLYNPPKW